MKNRHEFRDPIHVFVRVDTDERRVVDSRQFQRLRHIHQLALTHLIYPAATHRRFEHSLGVMELAGRVFDVVTDPLNVTAETRALLDELKSPEKVAYWKRVLRMAALCHDIGHLPFSHAAELELLPTGTTHEDLTKTLLLSDDMLQLWDSLTPPLRPDDIVKLALGPKKLKGERFSNWQALLAEIITGDAFGVDRMDYLLRDSHHLGVAYGRFDHHRLIDTLRILPSSKSKDDSGQEPALGVEQGGVQSAEALLLARYFMYSQVYCHRVRRAYDIHLKDFMAAWLGAKKYPCDPAGHLKMIDERVMMAIYQADENPDSAGHAHAQRILQRKHFRLVYERNARDVQTNPRAAECIFDALIDKFGAENVRHDRYIQKSETAEFPVLMADGVVASSMSVSDTLSKIPVVQIEYVFIAPEVEPAAKGWLDQNLGDIIKPKGE